MDATSGVALQVSQTRSELAINAVKQNAESDKKIADLLQSAAASVPGSPVRGTNVNIKA